MATSSVELESKFYCSSARGEPAERGKDDRGTASFHRLLHFARPAGMRRRRILIKWEFS